MLSKWKKSACAETAQSSRRKHRADIANRLTWSGPNDTEHEVPFLLSHLSERGGPPAACCDWDTPPRPRQPLPELKPKRGACCVVRCKAEGRLLPHSLMLTSNLIGPIWQYACTATPYGKCHATEVRGLRDHVQQRQQDIPALGRSASDRIELLSITQRHFRREVVQLALNLIYF